MTCEFFDVHISDKFCISDQNRGISQCYYGEIKEGFVTLMVSVPLKEKGCENFILHRGFMDTLDILIALLEQA